MKPVKHEWDARDYAKNSSAQLRWARELIKKLNLGGSESVLDIGCGDGKISAEISRIVKNGNVTGIDLSESMIELAKEMFPPDKNPNLTFLRMDASDISFTNKFDVAFSNATLHWVENHRSVLRGTRNSLKSGGRILLQMGGRGNASEIFSALEELISRPRWQKYYENFAQPYHFYGPDEYKTWLEESGFRPVHVDLVPKDMQHKGEEGLIGWMRTTWFPYTDCLPFEKRNDFLTEVIETYLSAHPADSQGITHVKMVRLEVEACAI